MSEYKNRDYYALVVIDDDRYDGAYSHAPYTAWWGIPPDDIDSGDTDCDIFWHENPDVLCGKGLSPQEALKDLIAKIEVRAYRFEPEFQPKFIEVSAPDPDYGKNTYMLYGSPEFVKWLEGGL